MRDKAPKVRSYKPSSWFMASFTSVLYPSSGSTGPSAEGQNAANIVETRKEDRWKRKGAHKDVRTWMARAKMAKGP